ncbi:hypothetical protein N3K66_004160 [Trichothecium roseum]|uniref:Uncharacterized protein n=1 Tax=Trichothecium roseum TaxID=47278 RepID=A0ACC0V2F6_9HYPO|nr:hypothetical protein N3K66_004160 [Trichothecium roseum]
MDRFSRKQTMRDVGTTIPPKSLPTMLPQEEPSDGARLYMTPDGLQGVPSFPASRNLVPARPPPSIYDHYRAPQGAFSTTRTSSPDSDAASTRSAAAPSPRLHHEMPTSSGPRSNNRLRIGVATGKSKTTCGNYFSDNYASVFRYASVDNDGEVERVDKLAEVDLKNKFGDRA